MARNQEVERFKKCWRCQKTNTVHIATSDTDNVDLTNDLVFNYWCWECEHHFAYRIRVENVHDQRGRI